jgi:hypothetical protein
MVSLRLGALAAAALSLGLGACGGKSHVRSYPEPAAGDVVGRMAATRAKATAFRASTRMDYWLGDDRVRSKVLIMGQAGAKVRINFLSPAGDSVMADLACDGAGFVFVDFQNNCALTGPCTADSIARFLRVRLAPDDFLAMATGTSPVIEGDGKVRWDAKRGLELVELAGAAGTQTLTLDGKEGRWDLIASALRDGKGDAVWSLEHKGFRAVKDAAGQEFRVPGKSRFVSPKEKADLLVDWEERVINPELDDTKFHLEPPAGLATCGQKK